MLMWIYQGLKEKKFLGLGVTDGIRKPKELIEKALNSTNEIPIYHHTTNDTDNIKNEKQRGSVYISI